MKGVKLNIGNGGRIRTINRTLDYIFKLTDISGPPVFLQRLNGFIT